MPTYEYKCDACGHKFEKFQSITAAPIRKCPECGKNKVKRLIGTGAGLIFKGSGFYITDYRSDAYKNAAKSESGAPSGDGAKTDGAKTDGAKTDGAKKEGAAKPAAEAAPSAGSGKSESAPASAKPAASPKRKSGK
jgi:putative FmdB family regulatory protein